MIEYEDKQELIDEILKRSKLFVNEFSHVSEKDKDKLVEGIDRTPAQMIAYQLGWLNLILNWEKQEQEGKIVITPHPDYKWNNLGELYESFYKKYEKYSLHELCIIFEGTVQEIVLLIESYTDTELFQPEGRKWASSTPANWPICKWIHINTVAPFKSFRSKIRKLKKINNK